MGKRHDLWAVASLLVGRYGRGARAQAEAHARDAERDGDDDAQAIWADVAGALHGRAAAFRQVPRSKGD